MCYNYKNKENREGVRYEIPEVFFDCKYDVVCKRLQ